jgi:DNA adenine methylase
MITERIKPVIKWVGGKSSILNQIVPNLEKKLGEGTYWEPFLGSGSVAFALRGKKVVLSDYNPMLINMYKVIAKKGSCVELLENLEYLRSNYIKSKVPKEYFLKIKETYNTEKEIYLSKKNVNLASKKNVNLASFFIFLNKTCFNAVMGENKDGKMNCSYNNDIKTKIFVPQRIWDLHAYIKDKEIICASFTNVLNRAKKDDLVFLDPPYYPLKSSSFVYNKFYEKDHNDIISIFKMLDKKGVKVLMTNSNTDFIKKNLKSFYQKPIIVKRLVSSNSKTRNNLGHNEVIISNFKID